MGYIGQFEEWFDGQDKEFNCSVVSLIEHLWNVLDKRVRAIRRLKGSAANVLVPDTTAHLQRQVILMFWLIDVYGIW